MDTKSGCATSMKRECAMTTEQEAEKREDIDFEERLHRAAESASRLESGIRLSKMISLAAGTLKKAVQERGSLAAVIRQQ